MSIAKCALIDSRIRLLEKQNDEKKVREAARPTVLGKGKILSWEDVVAAQKKQKEKAVSKGRRVVRKTKGKAAALQPCRRERAQVEEVVEAERTIAAAGLSGFCTGL